MNTTEQHERTRRVGVLGYGAIGSVVANCLADGRVHGAHLSAVGVRDGRRIDGLPTCDPGELSARSDLVVEAGGQLALITYGAEILNAGTDLLAVSVGALADEAVFDALTSAGPGRLHLSTGAIGGIDMVRAVAAFGPIHRASITTTKKPASLVQPTMSEVEAARVSAVTAVTTLFDGDVRELVKRFPTSTNVAATLALAVGSWDIVRGVVRADPLATMTSHVIEVEARSGEYRFEMRHHPSADNPRSSAVVPWAVVSSLRDICDRSWRFE